MASVEEVKAQIAQAIEKVSEAQGKLNAAHNDVEQAQDMYLQALEGSGHRDGSAGVFQALLEMIHDAMQGVWSTTQAAEEASAAL